MNDMVTVNRPAREHFGFVLELAMCTTKTLNLEDDSWARESRLFELGSAKRRELYRGEYLYVLLISCPDVHVESIPTFISSCSFGRIFLS